MAAKKKTRGKSQLGKGRWSPSKEAAQIRNVRAGRPGPTWAVTALSGLEEDTTGGRQRQKERSGPTTRWSKHRIAAANAARASGDASNTPGEKAAPRDGKGGRAKASAARAAATRARNIAKSKKAGTYAKTAKNQTARNRARSGAAGFNPKLGRSSPTDFIRGGRAPGGIPRKKL